MNILRGKPVFLGRHFFVLLIAGLILLHHSGTQAAQARPVSSKYAYYLFIDGDRTGCEACYVPLLITQNALEQVAAGNTFEEGILIITYERDSIWQSKGTVRLPAKDIEVGTRIVRLNGKRYRYQEIGAKEVLKLLENPMGSIPISRPAAPGMTLEKSTRDELIRVFKEQ
jgi:hypothetical protein